MSLVVLLILAFVWAVFLVPQVVRARAEKTPADSIGAFRNQLSVLERTSPGMAGRSARSAYAPARYAVSQRELVRRRRQAILFGLLGAMAVTLLLGLLASTFLVLQVLTDLLFVGYCALLVRARNLATERDMKVRYLPGPAYAAQPTLLLQRSGG